MKLRHDPREKMNKKTRARYESVNHPLTNMEPEELDAWIDENVKSVEDIRGLLKTLILAVGALKR